MDTLCIPIRPSDLALKLVQIDKMASIYAGAECTLVLDAELMATKLRSVISSCGCKRLGPESRARIACSTWMSRS